MQRLYTDFYQLVSTATATGRVYSRKCMTVVILCNGQ